jgi:RNA polymerase sigma-70 factor (ECF subfamily)
MLVSTEKQQDRPETTDVSVDQQFFLSQIGTYQRMLFKVCWAYTHTSHDRDDLLQEIVGQLWAGFGRYDRGRPFSTWMYRVALNVAIDFHRRRRRPGATTLSLEDMLEPSLSQNESKQEQLQELHELLERHSEADRAILLLSLEGNSYAEIADIIGISESNVGTRLSRLKKSLREIVQTQQS